jgi:hypothetical protein
MLDLTYRWGHRSHSAQATFLAPHRTFSAEATPALGDSSLVEAQVADKLGKTANDLGIVKAEEAGP